MLRPFFHHFQQRKLPQRELREIELPQTVIESFARFLVPEIWKYYESEQR